MQRPTINRPFRVQGCRLLEALLMRPAHRCLDRITCHRCNTWRTTWARRTDNSTGRINTRTHTRSILGIMEERRRSRSTNAAAPRHPVAIVPRAGTAETVDMQGGIEADAAAADRGEIANREDERDGERDRRMHLPLVSPVSLPGTQQNKLAKADPAPCFI